MLYTNSVLIVLSLIIGFIAEINGHGRLMEPPQRYVNDCNYIRSG